jgi:hypothetical protein
MTATEWQAPEAPPGPGWVVFSDPPELVHAHFTRDERGRWRVDGLYLAGPALDSGVLRRLSIPSWEARANAPEMQEQMERNSREPTAVEYRAAVAKHYGSVGRGRARLQVPPPPRAKPDVFYKRVADVYRELVGWTNRPAVELAEANGVPVTTAHRWVKEARRRGFLPPGQKGRRG